MATGLDPTMATTPSHPPTSVQVARRDSTPQKSEEDLSQSNVALSDLEKAASNDALPAPVETNIYFVDFEGPDDPGNPKSWTEKRRWGITVSMGLMVFTVTFASSIFSVNIGYVQEKFDVELVTATLGVSLFVLVRRSPDAL